MEKKKPASRQKKKRSVLPLGRIGMEKKLKKQQRGRQKKRRTGQPPNHSKHRRKEKEGRQTFGTKVEERGTKRVGKKKTSIVRGAISCFENNKKHLPKLP